MGQIKFIDSDNTLQVLGVAQNDFNLSFVIDGTKDSAKIEVVSFAINEEIKPNTILYHEDTNSWWIVSNDKVEYYINEQGYLYKHILKLQGLIELLNARDLTDCGFFANNYTIREFIFRLFELSNMNNFGLDFDTTNYEFDLDTNVDYTKSFENYTLLSALREFLDGYNVSAKARLVESTVFTGHYNTFELIFISKTGNGTPISEDVFNNVKQTRTIDKNSYGVTVISNAENVISTKAKTFPSIGAVKLSSTSGTVDRENAILRLPSNIYKINYLQMMTERTFVITAYNENHTQYLEKEFRTNNDNKEELKKKVLSLFYGTEYYQQIVDTIDAAVENMSKVIRTTLWTGWNFNAINNSLIPPKDNNDFYFPQYWQGKKVGPIYVWNSNGPLKIATKEERDLLPYPITCLYYERGKNFIGGFEMFGTTDETYEMHLNGGNTGFLSTDLQSDTTTLYSANNVTYVANTINNEYSGAIRPSTAVFRVNYIPMSDLKIEYDNAGVGEDIQLYNQNGKLTDSVALSKLLLSYSKEIESDNITRFGVFTNYNNVPKVGNIVNIDIQDYVINNISLNFFANEDGDNTNGYYIVGEFTLSKKIATKSLMTNPNTNIRDYGIPQNMNVKRKQLYRDFYELSHSVDTSADTDWYLPLNKVLNVSNAFKEYDEHICVMKITYDENIGGDSANNIESSKDWYYQLDTTTYIMKKAIYEIVDFKDNNIIGYGSQNIYSGFDVRRILNSFYDTINTPISYVDINGKFKDINFSFCTIDQVQEIYDDYKAYHNFTRDISLYNYSCFIDKEIFEGVSGQFSGARTKNDFRVNEQFYNKDAIEVPVFEYSCQIDDSDDVVIGENVFSVGEENEQYMYSIKIVDKDTINEYNVVSIDNEFIHPTYDINANNELVVNFEKTNNSQAVVEFTYDNNNKLSLRLCSSGEINVDTKEVTYGTNVNANQLTFQNKDIIVMKHTIIESFESNGDINYNLGSYDLSTTESELILITDGTNGLFKLNLTALGYFYTGFDETPTSLTPIIGYIGGVGNDSAEVDITDSVTDTYVDTINGDYWLFIEFTYDPLYFPNNPIHFAFEIVQYAEKQKKPIFKKDLMFIIKNNNNITVQALIELMINHYKTN